MTCRVFGRSLSANGEPTGPLTFSPAHSGVWDGATVSGRDVTVAPAADGTFEVELVPSEAVGPYRVRAGGEEWTATVPTVRRARLVDIVAGPGQ